MAWLKIRNAGDSVAKMGCLRSGHWAYRYGLWPNALTLILVAPQEHTERLTVARPAVQVVAGPGRWQHEQTHHGRPVGHAVEADLASACVSNVQTHLELPGRLHRRALGDADRVVVLFRTRLLSVDLGAVHPPAGHADSCALSHGSLRGEPAAFPRKSPTTARRRR